MPLIQDKTKNDWEDRGDFVKYNGKYDLVKMDYSAGETKVGITLIHQIARRERERGDNWLFITLFPKVLL